MNVQHEKSRLFALLKSEYDIRSYPPTKITEGDVVISHSPKYPKGPMVVLRCVMGNYSVYKPKVGPRFTYTQYRAAFDKCEKRAKLLREWVKEYNEERGHN